MTQNLMHVMALSLVLGACGGGATGGMTIAPPPPPPAIEPPPADTTAYEPAVIFAEPAGSQTYASLGYAYDIDVRSWDDRISYDAIQGVYTISYGADETGQIDDNVASSNDTYIAAVVRDHSGSEPVRVESFSILRPGSDNDKIALTYTSAILAPLGYWDYGTGGYMAFGMPTPASAVPRAGSATYAAVAFGQSLSLDYRVGGDVQLDFDFAAGSLAGYYTPVVTDGAGEIHVLARQDFANTVFGVGSAFFSGSFAGIEGSSFEGRFTGPAAEELIARFQQTMVMPNEATDTLIGVWVGKR